MAEIVYLHVGPHKTGTTALQRAFAENVSHLAGYGIHYPMSGRDDDAHHALARAVSEGDTGLVADVASEIAGEDKVLISSELFAALPVPALTCLRDTLDCAEVVAVYLLRPLPPLVVSHWKEMVKHGLPDTAEVYFSRELGGDPTGYSTLPSPFNQLTRLAQAFGSANMSIGRYSDLELGEGFGRAFLERHLDVSVRIGAFTTPMKNFTPTDAMVAVLGLMNQRARNVLDASQRRILTERVLARLQHDPPDWMQDFERSLSEGEVLVLSESTPWIASEQAKVIGAFKDVLGRAAEEYQVPASSQVCLADRDALEARFGALLDGFFSALVQSSLEA